MTMTEDQIERMAQAIHEKYRLTKTGLPEDPSDGGLAGKSWEQLSEDEKEANRAQARNIVVKIEAIGFTLVPLDDPEAEQLTVPVDAIEPLAEYEHQRWIARSRCWQRQREKSQRHSHQDDEFDSGLMECTGGGKRQRR